MGIRLNLSVILSVFLVLGLQSCSKNKQEPGVEIFPDMVHSVAYEAYGESDLTPDGKSMMLPPKNSIPRGRMPFRYGADSSEAKRAGVELVNPLAATKSVLERGKIGYDNYCLVCHGVKGKGDGPLIPKFPNPPSLTGRRIRKYKDGRLYHIITMGSGDMPSHAVQIDREDRWAIVHYVNYIQETYKRK